ncbi:MAG: helix-turn-helix domain-containing protein [Acidimicrobiales bacterium]
MFLSTKEAAEVVGVSATTIRRRIEGGAYPGARRMDPDDPASPWRIPASDVIRTQLSGVEERAPVDVLAEAEAANRGREAAEARARKARAEADELAAEVTRLRAVLKKARTAERAATRRAEVAETRAEIEQRVADRLDLERTARIDWLEGRIEVLDNERASRRSWWRRRAPASSTATQDEKQ